MGNNVQVKHFRGLGDTSVFNLSFTVNVPSEKWKRNESVFAKRWGTNNSREEHDVIRPEYIESKEVSRKRSEITGKPIYWFVNGIA